jgi:putative membrane-bound dehydrogenase-like protein
MKLTSAKPENRTPFGGRSQARDCARAWLRGVLLSGLTLLMAAWSRVGGRGEAAEPEAGPAKQEWTVSLARIPATEPAAAQRLFKVQPDVRFDLVASEPLVVDPVAMSFDESGALFVVEMRDYSEQAEEKLGRVRRLTDEDGDGVFDRSTIFAEGLSWPTAVFCYDGGVFVAAAPDVSFLRDVDGDGKADESKVVFTGLGRGNVQGLVNSFQWGLDNRIYAAVSSSGAALKHVAAPEGGVLELQGRDFSFDPRTNLAEPATGGGQHGMCFDRWGNRFVCSNSDHLQAIVFEDRYLQANPFQAAPGSRRSIAADGPQAEVYRSSPVEAWREIRTQMRLSGFAPGQIEGGGRASGYFTSGTGVTVDEGGLFGDHFVLIADVGSNLIHRKRLVPDGVTYRGERVDRESELVASSDNWFRPVQMAVGPEGGLYVADMYREVIEHPLSLPPQLKAQLDLTSGRDRGRIYRLTPASFAYRAPPLLQDASPQQLADELQSPNMWRRSTAARLLYQRQDKTAAEFIERNLRNASEPAGRIAMLHALAGLDSLGDELLGIALADAHPQVRRHAVWLSERRLDESSVLFDEVRALADDDQVVVLFQLALSLGTCENPRVGETLAEIARRTTDKDVVAAALVSAHSSAGAMLSAAITNETWRSSATGRKVVSSLIAQIKRQGRYDDVAAVTRLLQTAGAPSLSSPAAEALVALGAIDEETSAAANAQALAPLLAARNAALERLISLAKAEFVGSTQPTSESSTAIRLLALGDLEANRSLLVERLSDPEAGVAADWIVAALGRRRSPIVADVLLSAWDRMNPRLRGAASSALCSRESWASDLLDACESEEIRFADLPPTCATTLCNSPSDAIRRRAQALRGKNDPAERQAAFRDYQSVLAERGDAARGKVVFEKNCSTCHQVQGVGYEIGPNLTAMINRGAEAVLYNILAPNAEIDPRYTSSTVLTSDGRVFSGIVAAETASSVTLKGPQGELSTILRVDVEELRNTGVSLMPEGLEKSIDKTAMADLLAFLQKPAESGGGAP